jgi:hypothetical protein
VRSKPTGTGEIFLSKIGLGSWLSRSVTLLIFLLLIYLVFIPNVFFVKHITINDAQISDKPAIEALVNSYLSKKLPWPQRNLVLLSKAGLKNFLLKNDQKILGIESINKKLPSTLVLSITPRVDRFIIQTANGTYFSVSSDGLLTNEVFPDASGTLPSNLTPIKLDDNDGVIVGNKAFNQTGVNFLNQIQNQFPEIVKSATDYYELSGLQTPDLTIYLKTGLKIKLALNSDAAQTLNHLRLLFSQFTDSDIKKLYYIDMRFGDNGYVCYKGTACVQEISLPAASTTPANLLK